MSEQLYDGIAGNYDANRASYPWDLMLQFRDVCRIPEGGGIVLDVGSGTGISTRQLREVYPTDIAVIGIEPGDDMRRTAPAFLSLGNSIRRSLRRQKITNLNILAIS